MRSMDLRCVIQKRDLVFRKPYTNLVLLTLSGIEVPDGYDDGAFYAARITIDFSDGTALTQATEVYVDPDKRTVANVLVPRRFVTVMEASRPAEDFQGAKVAIGEIGEQLEATPLRDRFAGRSRLID